MTYPASKLIEKALIELLDEHGSVSTADSYEMLADKFHLTEEDLARQYISLPVEGRVKINKSESQWQYDVRSARQKLVAQGKIAPVEQSGRGIWKLTEITEQLPKKENTKRIFGTISNFPIGSTFRNRTELSKSKVHTPLQAGISGSSKDGADSIVLNGGYIDDEDHGDEVIYTGHGGRNSSGKTIEDQTITAPGNAGLKISFEEGYPVRVTRGSKGDPTWSPSNGYRYDGLYRVTSFWHEKGIDGYLIWRFRLVSLDNSNLLKIDSPVLDETEDRGVERVYGTSNKLIRNRVLVDRIKNMYDWTCQVCSIRIDTPSGPYAEAAHIKPLGRPHDGPDKINNMLCLCPNHHKLFDKFGFYIEPESFEIKGLNGFEGKKITLNKKHKIENRFLKYHKKEYTKNN